MSTVAELNAKIQEQGDLVRKLKADKSPDAKSAVDDLLALKAELAKISGGEAKGAAGGKKAVKFTLKTAKVRFAF